MNREWVKYLARPREALRQRRADLAEEIEKVDRELADLDAAERVLKRLDEFEAQWELIIEPVEPGPPTHKFQGTTKQLTIQILKDAYPRGYKAGEIRELAEFLHATKINPNTLTVTLGRLRAEETVRNDARTWFYVPPKKRDAPSAEADEAS